MKVLIAGCGDIGTRLGMALKEKNHQVYGLKRNINELPQGFVPICVDLFQSVDENSLPKDIDQVFYILAASGFNEQAYEFAYVTGVKNLVAGLGRQIKSIKRFVFVSSTSVYAQNDGQWVNEESITVPSSFNGQIMLKAEKQVLTLPNSHVVRFSGIYGPGRTRMFEQVKSGQLTTAQPVIYSNRIHVEDCANVLAFLSQKPSLEDGLILASDHSPSTLHEIHNWLADQIGLAKENRRYQNSTRRAGSKRISNKRLQEYGYEFIYPSYQQGYADYLK